MFVIATKREAGRSLWVRGSGGAAGGFGSLGADDRGPTQEEVVTEMSTRPAIRVEGLTKSFGDVHALRGIDLSVPRGTVLGVLGPNGAGKTTAVRILTTLLPPDGGRALVEGYDVARSPAAVRRTIGLAGQS